MLPETREPSAAGGSSCLASDDVGGVGSCFVIPVPHAGVNAPAATRMTPYRIMVRIEVLLMVSGARLARLGRESNRPARPPPFGQRSDLNAATRSQRKLRLAVQVVRSMGRRHAPRAHAGARRRP